MSWREENWQEVWADAGYMYNYNYKHESFYEYDFMNENIYVYICHWLLIFSTAVQVRLFSQNAVRIFTNFPNDALFYVRLEKTIRYEIRILLYSYYVVLSKR